MKPLKMGKDMNIKLSVFPRKVWGTFFKKSNRGQFFWANLWGAVVYGGPSDHTKRGGKVSLTHLPVI